MTNINDKVKQDVIESLQRGKENSRLTALAPIIATKCWKSATPLMLKRKNGMQPNKEDVETLIKCIASTKDELKAKCNDIYVKLVKSGKVIEENQDEIETLKESLIQCAKLNNIQ